MHVTLMHVSLRSSDLPNQIEQDFDFKFLIWIIYLKVWMAQHSGIEFVWDTLYFSTGAVKQDIARVMYGLVNSPVWYYISYHLLYIPKNILLDPTAK